ncbi:DUF1674 domain-containing protein [Aerophototrophica crusticola]|uniref:DUF1674 domain-containing protein n=1 Tax=Aerophototrophica crusticola TaxID=1709002 RepID=UPI00384B512B
MRLRPLPGPAPAPAGGLRGRRRAGRRRLTPPWHPVHPAPYQAHDQHRHQAPGHRGHPARRRPAKKPAAQPPGEIGGPAGPEPTRYGDWEQGGRCSDF